MSHDKKIQKLERGINELEKQRDKLLTEKYGHLIGKCMHRQSNAWELITNIRHVRKDVHDGDEIHFDALSVIYDDRFDFDERFTIDIVDYRDMYVKDFVKYEIPKEDFVKEYDKVTSLIRAKILNQQPLTLSPL